ncbi:MAG TPA: cytochrome c3 family protein, partial [Candidatus Dormibacteraeota bacterium]|nr:cytochrome c3 family protein [Candidatus Dormibacteraeota bacterium]
ADSRPSAYDKSHPTSGDCSGCHTTTPTFYTNQSGSSAKPANHIPTNAPCAQCHTTAGNYALYVMGATGHAGITNGCATCHAYGKRFYNMAPPTLKEPPSGATGHIPVVPPNGTGSVACELCHLPTVFTTFSGTVMRHAYVTSMKCDSCHEYGMTWKVNSNLWKRPSPNHHAGQDCGGSGCHSSRDKLALRPVALPQTATRAATGTTTTTTRASSGPNPRAITPAVSPTPRSAPGTFDHSSVAGQPCVSCHSAASGAGKPAGHIATTDACQSCHTTQAWLPLARVDHSQVKGSCVSCHNGGAAMGKPAGHMPTSADCASCHTTNSWTTVRFDHAAVAPHSCSTCHNGVQAIGMPRAHIPTTQQCDACHGTLAWKPVKIDHTGLTSGCAACHNNAGATGLPPAHLITRIDCGLCHSYPDWGVLHFRHASAAYPGNHRAALSCVSCHTTNTDKVTYASPADAGSCAGCHAKDFKPAAHPRTVKGLDYTAHELANCSGACHVYSDSTQSTITRSLPGPYHRVTDAKFKR